MYSASGTQRKLRIIGNLAKPTQAFSVVGVAQMDRITGPCPEQAPILIFCGAPERDASLGIRGLILAVAGGTIAGVSTELRELLIRHVDAGTIPGGVALLGAENVEVVTAGVASVGSGPMGEDAIMRIQSTTKVITSVAALRLVEAGRLELDQSLVDWLPELADRQVLRRPAAELDDTEPARQGGSPRHLVTTH